MFTWLHSISSVCTRLNFCKVQFDKIFVKFLISFNIVLEKNIVLENNGNLL